MTLLGREPVLVLAVVQAGIALGSAFGLSLSGDQIGAVTAFSAAVLGFAARQRVSPIATAAMAGGMERATGIEPA